MSSGYLKCFLPIRAAAVSRIRRITTTVPLTSSLNFGISHVNGEKKALSSSAGPESCVAFDETEFVEIDEARQPWKRLLEAPARAAWRVTNPHPPSALVESWTAILEDGNRTPKQLKRAFRQVLSIQSDLAEFRERERRRMVNGKYYRLKDLNDYEEDDTVHPVCYGYDQTLASLKHRLLPNFAITRRVLEECKSLIGPRFSAPRRVLDFGIGCGSASAAALDMFDSVEWIHGIDPSLPMRQCSQRLIEGISWEREIVPRITYSSNLSVDSTTSSGGNFDLALCTYTASELPDIMSNLAAAAMLFGKLKPDGVLVMIEPGTPDGFNSIRAVRNMLLDCCPPDDPDFEWPERCHVVAPCTHNGKCPMERHKKDFVKRGKLGHDLPQVLDSKDVEEVDMFDFDEDSGDFEDFITESWYQKSLSETDVFNSSFCSFVQTHPTCGKKGEKVSYLVVEKKACGHVSHPTNPFENDNLTELLASAHEAAAKNDVASARDILSMAQDLETRYLESSDDELGLELVRGKRETMGRIVRAPIKKKGHIYIDYCSAPGRIIRSRVSKSSSNVAPGIYSAARKSRWGGLWPDNMDRSVSS